MSHTVYYYLDKKGTPRSDVFLDGNKFINSDKQPVNIKRCSNEEYEVLLKKKAIIAHQSKLF